MMTEYFLRLALLLPLLALLIWGSLRLTRYLQTRIVGAQSEGKAVELMETTLLAPGLKLAVVRFHDQEILLGCSRSGLVRLGEAERRIAGRVIAPNPSPERASNPAESAA